MTMSQNNKIVEMLNKVSGMHDRELVANLQRYSQMIGSGHMMNNQKALKELCGIDMVYAEEILKRLSLRDGVITSLERELLDDLIRPSIGSPIKSRLIEDATSQDLDFRVLLENIKSLYNRKPIFGVDHRDWNKLLEELLD